MKELIKYIITTLAMLQAICVYAQQDEDSFNFSAGTSYVGDSLYTDSLIRASDVSNKISYGLMDTIANDTILNSIFKSYVNINNQYIERKLVRKNLPTVKEIRTRPQEFNKWKFTVIMLIMAYVAFVRISNSNNFRTFLLSVFNLKLSRKIWEDQRSFFGFVIIQLFAIYLFIAAIFISNYMEIKHILLFENYGIQFGAILLILAVIYLSKFILHYILGILLQMKNLAIGFVSNTISVNNFVALIIFPVTIFSIYANNSVLALVLSQAIIAIFFVSVLYRIVRILLLSNSFFSFPTFYLFLYLCALEIAPWFIIVKFLNKYHT
jgi:hypothetical protein